MRSLIVPLLFLTFLLAAAGIYVATRFEGPPEDTTAAFVPAEASAYVSFFVDPSSDQKVLLRDRIEEGGEGLEAGSLVEDVLDRVTSAFGLTYRQVSPWIDRQMAAFVTARGDGAVVVEIADEDLARTAMERVDGLVLGDHAVFGDRPAVRAAEALFEANGKGSLSGPGAHGWDDTMRDVPEDRLALALAGGAGLSGGAIDLPTSLDPVELALGIGQGNAVSLRADQNGLVFDGFSYSDGAILLLTGPDPKLRDLGTASRDSWLAGIVPNLSAWVDALDHELRQVHKVGTAPLGRLPVPDAIEGTDQTMFWVAGENVQRLSAGIDATVDGEEQGARLARALVEVGPVQPTFEFGRNRLRATFGSQNGRLGSSSRYDEAARWLGDLSPVGYLDAEAARPFLSMLTLVAVPFPSWLEDVDRIAVGLDPEASPTHWRVVVSLGS